MGNYSLRFEKVGAILDLLVLSSFCGSSVITFQLKIYWVPCGRNSSYSFPWKYTGYLVGANPLTVFHENILGTLWAQILLQFSMECFETLKICMWFGYTFSRFLCFVNLVFFRYEMLSKYIDSGYLVGEIPLTVFQWLFWNFADVFCMEWRCACGFGIILWLFFLTFFYFVNLVIWNFAVVFCMKWRCACDLDIILWLFFLTFSALWT